MSSETGRRRFRIEPLEERIAPASLFWAEGLSTRMTAEWLSNCANEQVVHAELALRLPTHVAARSTNGLEFPAWAEELLKQVDARLESNTAADTSRANQARQTARLDELVKLVHPQETEQGHLPAWAEELLAHVDRRLDHEAQASLQQQNDAEKSRRLDQILEAICQPEPLQTSFPEWAEEMLAEVDRRLEMTASMSAQQLARLENVMDMVCSPNDSTHFPAWAENLLQEVDRRLEAASEASTGTDDSQSLLQLDEVMSLIRQPGRRAYASVR